MKQMANLGAARKPGRGIRPQAAVQNHFVDFTWQGVSYVLDLDRSQVYRNWMAVETNKGFAILGAYRHSAAIPA